MMLEISDLDFDYQEQPVLRNISFHVPPGGLLHIKGANGAGKTTLLKLIAGLYQPGQGCILFNGQSIHSNLTLYQSYLCYVGHKAGINTFLTVKENCLFDVHNTSGDSDVVALASLFKLEPYLNQLSGLLSAGQRRMVALLRLWMSQAKLWLLDEPLVALDKQTISILMKKIESHRAQGGAVLLSSHQNLPLSPCEYVEYQL